MAEPAPCTKCHRLHQPMIPCPNEGKENKRIILTEEDVRGHVEHGGMELVEARELLQNTAEFCVDGRGENKAIGTPGGNAGEFVLYLGTYETMTGKNLSDEQVVQVLGRYLEEYGKFYMHTDSPALEHMCLSRDELLNPDPAKRNGVLDKLCDPNHVGCGHLKLAMKNFADYGIRPDLIKSFFRAFFEKLWDHDANVELDILEGEHKEGAVIIVIVDEVEEFGDNSMVPAIKPNIGQTQAFVYHPQAVGYMRKKCAERLNSIIPPVTGTEVEVAAFADQLISNGKKVLSETVGRLARDDSGKSLPKFVVHVDQNGRLVKVEKEAD